MKVLSLYALSASAITEPTDSDPTIGTDERLEAQNHSPSHSGKVQKRACPRFMVPDVSHDERARGATGGRDVPKPSNNQKTTQSVERSATKESVKVAKTKPKLRRSNSTSSLYISQSVLEPDNEQMLVNIARLLTFMITDAPKEECSLTPRGANAPKPTAAEIFTYIATVYNVGHWTKECNLIMIVLVSRFVGAGRFKLHNNNWHVIVLVAFMVAQKLWDDIPLGNVEFVEILRIVAPTCEPNKSWARADGRFINHIERTFLGAIHFDVFVKRKVYIEFLLELDAFQRAFQGDTSRTQPLGAIQARLIGLSSVRNSPQLVTKQKKTSSDAEGVVTRGGIAVLS
jgi:hypothetical protein